MHSRAIKENTSGEASPLAPKSSPARGLRSSALPPSPGETPGPLHHRANASAPLRGVKEARRE